jgi:hypothetical protein
MALLGLAAALALLLGISGALLLTMSRTAPPAAVAASANPIVTSTGAQVGEVSEGWYQGSKVLVVRVQGAPAGRRYRCELVLRDGTRHSVGDWTMPASGAATWVVDHPGGDIAQMQLVTPSGQAWATATL